VKEPEYEIVEFDPNEKFHAHYLVEPHRSRVMSDVRAAAQELGLDSENLARLVFRSIEDEDELPGIVLSTVRNASGQLGSARALDILERERISHVHRHGILSDLLANTGTPLYTLDELSELVAAFAEHLKENRAHLLATGYPHTSFSRSQWLHLRLSWLYPIKTPEEVGTRPTSSGDLEYVYGWRTKRLRQNRIMLLPYETAPLRDEMGVERAARVNRLRKRFFGLKLRVVQKVANVVRGGRADTAVVECLQVLASGLTYGQAELLLNEDTHTRNFGSLTKFIAGDRWQTALPWSVAGGIAGIMEVLYHCERELSGDFMGQTKREILALARNHGHDWRSLLGSAAYYRALAEPWRAELEGILNRYVERNHAASRAHPWGAFAKRVDEYLERELKHAVGARTRVTKEHAAQMKGRIRGFLWIMKGSLETTGSLPQLSVTVASAGAEAAGNEFRKEGQFWTIRYGGTSISLADSMGVRLLAVLLRSPGRAISVLELRAAVTGQDVILRAGSAGPRLSQQARKEYEQRVEELVQQLAQVPPLDDEGRRARLADEKDAIEHELRGGVGLGGRSRKDADDAERARQAVGAAIKRTLKVMDLEHHELWLHLKNSLRLGALCAYQPEGDPGWTFQP
jgi:hypothetical protein